MTLTVEPIQQSSVDLEEKLARAQEPWLRVPIGVPMCRLLALALVFALAGCSPDGWTTEAGTTYAVEVTGITPTIEYEVEVVDCTQPVP